MLKLIPREFPSFLYGAKIQNVSDRMRNLVSKATLMPLKNMTSFNQLDEDFLSKKGEAQASCKAMDDASSVKGEEKATAKTLLLIKELIELRNLATKLVEREINEVLQERDNLSAELGESFRRLSQQNRSLIEHDPILKHDLECLLQDLLPQSESRIFDWKKLLDHMIAEVKSDADDDQRMSDESSNYGCEQRAECRSVYHNSQLQNILENMRRKLN